MRDSCVKSILALYCLLFAVFCLTLSADACPACSEAVSEGSDALSQGYARSIGLLMAAPYLLFAGLTLAIVRSARRKR